MGGQGARSSRKKKELDEANRKLDEAKQELDELKKKFEALQVMAIETEKGYSLKEKEAKRKLDVCEGHLETANETAADCQTKLREAQQLP